MTPKTFVLHVDHQNADGPQTKYAMALAKMCDAHIHAIVLAPEYTVPSMVMAEIPVSVIETQRANAAAEAQKMADAFNAKAEAAGIDVTTEILSDTVDGLAMGFSEIARTGDLVILGQFNPDRESALATALIESVLFDSGRPLLVVPYIGGHDGIPKRPLIAWDASAPSARAANDSFALLDEAESVEVVTVDLGKDLTRIEKSGASLVRVMNRRGIKARYHVIPSGGLSAANALLSHASDVGADLVVMGGYSHSRMREIILGGATREILATMTVPVMMAH